MKKIYLGFLLIFLSSCMATPDIHVKSSDMSMAIKQKAPVVGKVDISPDGRYALSGGFDSFILWDILQGKKIQTFTHAKAFMGDTIAIAFSPDGKYFASGGKGTILWDLAARQPILTFDDNRAVSIAFSPDGKYILCGGPPSDLGLFSKPKPPTMKIFDVTTGGEIRDFKLKYILQNYIWSVAYSPDGKYILSGDSGGKMTLWNASLGRPVKTVVGAEGLFDRRVQAVAFSLDGEYALSGGSDNSVRLWNAKSLAQIKKFTGHSSFAGVSSVAFSPDGKYAITSGYDSMIKIWDLSTGHESKNLIGHTGISGTSAKFFPNGKYVISAGDASTRIWDVSTGEEVASMIAFEDGEWIITTANGYYNSSPKGDQYLSEALK